MSVAVEIFGFFIAALGLLMLGLTLTHSNWRVSSMDGNIITTSAIFENLWYSCATDSLGVYNCWEFPSMLSLSGESFSRPLPRPRGDDKKPYAAQLPRPHWALPCPPYTAPWCKEGPQLGLLLETSRDIQACRALMITAILLGSLGLFLGMVGLRCTNIGGLEPSRKTKLAATAGALHLLAGPSAVLLSLPQVSVGSWPSPGTPSASPGTSSTPCTPEPSMSWAPPSTWAGAPPCSPSWVARASSPTAAALGTRTTAPASGFPTRPRQCPPKASLPACPPRPRMKKATAALASTGKTLTCRWPGLWTPFPSHCPQRRGVPVNPGLLAQAPARGNKLRAKPRFRLRPVPGSRAQF
ncbi:claudin-15 isoform X1 [Physeter macrocephalus]|uniref:Claudin-15 isoform X1 n=1 Tax=Physeter macrocephalus TaxID=9755 RepID=A0A9W2WGK9_PHYMC|nr:claudin-15 isoform X1 [Physeter catodon]